jgi:thymidine phosphorylase
VVRADRSGTLMAIDAALVGRTAVLLGAGRDRAGDPVDPAAGVRLLAAVGEPVARGAAVLELHFTDQTRLAAAEAVAKDALGIGAGGAPGPLVHAWVHREGESLAPW